MSSRLFAWERFSPGFRVQGLYTCECLDAITIRAYIHTYIRTYIHTYIHTSGVGLHSQGLESCQDKSSPKQRAPQLKRKLLQR